jgi:DNA replication and repair protein RecF
LVITSIDIERFRNIGKASLEFSDSFNFITGRNAQGKTNLLEAIHLFSLGRSFRSRSIGEVIQFGEEHFFLRITGSSDAGVDFTIEIGMEAEGRVRVSANGAKMSGVGEIIGMIPSVLFVPDDVTLSAGPPRLRRLFLDYTAAQISPSFLSALKGYRTVLRNRNALLKTIAAGQGAPGELAAWDDMLIEKGAAIVRGRIEVLGEVLRQAREFSTELLPENELLDVHYLCSFNREGIDVEQALGNAVRRCREGEVRRGYTLVGPQYDDAVVYLGEMDLKRYGSQGRRRLSAVILKLAQARTIMAKRAERPVVLLDDIFSELDDETAGRVRGVLSDRYQSFVTSPRGEDFAGYGAPGACFTVEKGAFTSIEPDGRHGDGAEVS